MLRLQSNWRLTLLAMCLLHLVMLIPSANAGIVFDNGGPNQNGGNEMTDFLQSEDFILGGPALITDVHFWDLQLVPGDYKGAIYWALQYDQNGVPGLIAASGLTSAVTHTSTGLFDITGTYAEYVNSFNITPATLPAGTYWLTLHDGDVTDINFANFYWEWSADIGDGQEFDLIAGLWDSNGADHAFYLTGTPVPEPSYFMALATLLVAGRGARRFRF